MSTNSKIKWPSQNTQNLNQNITNEIKTTQVTNSRTTKVSREIKNPLERESHQFEGNVSPT